MVITLILSDIFLVWGFGLSSKVEDMYFTMRIWKETFNKIESIESEITNSMKTSSFNKCEIDFGKLDKKNLSTSYTQYSQRI